MQPSVFALSTTIPICASALQNVFDKYVIQRKCLTSMDSQITCNDFEMPPYQMFDSDQAAQAIL